MRRLRFCGVAVLLMGLGAVGCRSYCEKHYPCPQQPVYPQAPVYPSAYAPQGYAPQAYAPQAYGPSYGGSACCVPCCPAPQPTCVPCTR